MSDSPPVVITGLGVVSPLGVGVEAFWSGLLEGRSGVRAVDSFDASALPVAIAGLVCDFDPKAWVQPRKSLKFMARETCFAVAAAGMARQSAGLAAEQIDPDRLGVIFGADRIRNDLEETLDGFRNSLDEQGKFQIGLFGSQGMTQAFPLMMLKVLPNMPACHISILHDARGPNNSIQQAETSGLLAVAEAARVLERGMADAVICGAASSRMHPLDLTRACLMNNLSRQTAEPQSACRPFDVARSGQVLGEGAAAFLLETLEHAQRRGARVLARIAGAASAGSPQRAEPQRRAALCRAIQAALDEAGLSAGRIGHVNAHGLGTQAEDRIEAQALGEVLRGVPVTALKGHIGNLGAACGAIELAAAVLALGDRRVPAVRNHDTTDPQCPIDVIRGQPAEGLGPSAVAVNQTQFGQAAAMVLVSEG